MVDARVSLQAISLYGPGFVPALVELFAFAFAVIVFAETARGPRSATRRPPQ